LAALALAAFTVNKKANAHQGISVSLKTTPQFSSLRNSGDRNNGNIQHKSTVNASWEIHPNLFDQL